MKTIIKFILIFAISITFFSCEKLLMKPNANTTQTGVFEEYVKIVKEKYGMLEFKGVDIDHLSDSLRPFVNNDMSNDSLLNTLNVIIQQLKDGHTYLTVLDKSGTGTDYKGYDFLNGFDAAFDFGILIDNYIGVAIAPGIKILKGEEGELFRVVYGVLPQDNEIGYLFIPSFDVTITDEELETIFSSFSSAKGLIVDVRQNTGGDPILATKIAAYLTDKTVYTGYENFKTGPSTNEFASSSSFLKASASVHKFLKPVVVCTDRYVFSAGLTFCYSTNPLSNVTFIGQRIGGGSGSVGSGYLSNGWNWNMSISEFIGVDNAGNDMHLDNGFEPDILISLDLDDTSKDEILERAILELQ